MSGANIVKPVVTFSTRTLTVYLTKANHINPLISCFILFDLSSCVSVCHSQKERGRRKSWNKKKSPENRGNRTHSADRLNLFTVYLVVLRFLSFSLERQSFLKMQITI